jgi:hypothetical protein
VRGVASDGTTALDAEILWLVDLLTHRYAPDGIPIERVDCRSGEIIRDRFLLDELGDFLPNVAAAGVILSRPDALDWAVALVGRTRARRFRRAGLFEPFAFHRRRWRRLRSLGLAYPYWNLDTLTGLVALYEILERVGRASEAASLAGDIGEVLRSLLGPGRREGRLRYGFLPGTGFTLPFSSPQLTGYVAEELVRWGRLTGADWAIEAAAALLRAECESASFSARGVFQAEVHGLAAPLLRAALGLVGKPHFATPLLMKDNTLPAFALLALAEAGPAYASWALPVADRWREAVEAAFRDPSGHFARYAGRASGPAPSIRLTHNHSMIEWDIEAFLRTGARRHLDRAIEQAHRWLGLQTARGCFPESPEAPWNRRSLLDAQVDLSVNLLKLGELTDDATWTRAATANLAAIRRDFRLPVGYAWEVDSQTGEVREATIEVKYLGLLVKGFLAFHVASVGDPLRSSPLIWMLLRDR